MQKRDPEKRKHISFSELRKWVFCSILHKLNYIDGRWDVDEYTGPQSAGIFGTAMHAVCEATLQGKITTDEEKWVLFNLVTFDEEDKLEEPNATKFKAERLSGKVDADAALWKTIMPDILPALDAYFPDGYEFIEAEVELMEPIPEFEFVERKFKGFIDLVLKTPDGVYHVIDYKTCSWGWDMRKKSDPMVTYQLTLYKEFYARKRNIDRDKIETHFALLKRTAKKNRVELFRVTSGPKKTTNALSLLKKALYNIYKEKYIKNRVQCGRCPLYKTENCP